MNPYSFHFRKFTITTVADNENQARSNVIAMICLPNNMLTEKDIVPVAHSTTEARARQLFTGALSKFNWSASTLDADAIMLLNEVPTEIMAKLSNVSALAKKASDDGLTRGIAMAVSLSHRGCSEREILSECGIKSKKELREAGVEDFDLEGLGDLLPEE